MTDNDYQRVRESLYALGIDASQGAGDRLNQAMAVKSIDGIKGDADVKALVQRMLTKAAGGVYFAALNNLLSELNGIAAPVSPPPSQVPVPPKVVAPAPAPAPVPDDLRSQVVAILNSLGFVIKGDGNVRTLNLRAGNVSHRIANSANDGGLEKSFNVVDPGWRPGSSHGDPRMGQLIDRVEQDNTWSMAYFKPDLDPNPNTADELSPGAFDGLPGKSILVHFADVNGRHRQRLMIGSGMPGVELEFGVVPAGGMPNEPEPRLRLKASGVYVVDPDGTERKL